MIEIIDTNEYTLYKVKRKGEKFFKKLWVKNDLEEYFLKKAKEYGADVQKYELVRG